MDTSNLFDVSIANVFSYSMIGHFISKWSPWKSQALKGSKLFLFMALFLFVLRNSCFLLQFVCFQMLHVSVLFVCFLIHLFSFSIWKREAESSSITDSYPRFLWKLALGQAIVKSQNSLLVPRICFIICCLSKCTSASCKTRWQVQWSRLEPCTPIWNVGFPN